MSTKAGCCRMGIFNRGGRLIGGHFLSGIVYPGVGEFPTAEHYKPPPNEIQHWKWCEYVHPMYPTYQQRLEEDGDEFTSAMDTWRDQCREYKRALGLQGVPTLGMLPPVLTTERKFPRSHIEPMKIYALDHRRNLSGIRTVYHLSKPSTATNIRELHRFGDVIDYMLNDVVFSAAVEVAARFDRGVTTTFVEPVYEDFLAHAQKICGLKKSAGPIANAQHPEYTERMGGVEAMARRVMRLYARIMRGSPLEDDHDGEIEQCFVDSDAWSVVGKKDGYKAAKLDIGRTIQAPTLEMKILWLTVMKENDDLWVHQAEAAGESWVHAGEDFDRPVTPERFTVIAESMGVLALDQTAFDRYMTPEFIETFFSVYLPRVRPGIPKPLLGFWTHATINSVLVHTDGSAYRKARGNPSGFMNTLRLNNWSGLVAWLYAVGRRLLQLDLAGVGGSDLQRKLYELVDIENPERQLHFEICGDDSRVWATSELALKILDLPGAAAVLDIWHRELPWQCKVEGEAIFPPGTNVITKLYHAPPMVSRKFMVLNCYAWEPCYNMGRVLKGLVHFESTRTEEDERELVLSAATTLAVPYALWEAGLLVSATMDAFDREYLRRHPEVRKYARARFYKLALHLGGRLRIPAEVADEHRGRQLDAERKVPGADKPPNNEVSKTTHIQGIMPKGSGTYLPLANRAVADNLSTIARAVVLPKESPPLRLPVQTGNERTAVLSLEATNSVFFDAVNAGTIYALLVRHSLIPFWVSGTFSAAQVNYPSNTTVVLGSGVYWNNLPLDGTPTAVAGSLPSWLGATTVNNTIPVGQDTHLEADFFYVPPGATSFISVFFSATQGGTFGVQLYRWQGPDNEQLVNTLTNGIGGTSLILYTASLAGGWYRYANAETSFASATTSTSFAVGWITGGTIGGLTGTLSGMWPFNIPVEFVSTTSYPWTDTRTNSAAVLLTNVTEVLGKQGTVLGARLVAQDNYWVPQASIINSRAPNEKYFSALEHGCYTYSSPSPESQIYQRSFRQAGAAQYPLVLLDQLGYANQLVLSDNNTAPYGQMAVTANWMVEFRTTSVLFPSAACVTPLEEVHRAYVAVGMMPCFMMNDTHRSLLGMIGAAAKVVGRAVAQTFGGPMLSAAIHGGINLGNMAAASLRQSVPGGDSYVTVRKETKHAKPKQKKKIKVVVQKKGKKKG
jgi:hypothetical protein